MGSVGLMKGVYGVGVINKDYSEKFNCLYSSPIVLYSFT